jgi:hypothetical protein
LVGRVLLRESPRVQLQLQLHRMRGTVGLRLVRNHPRRMHRDTILQFLHLPVQPIDLRGLARVFLD